MRQFQSVSVILGTLVITMATNVGFAQWGEFSEGRTAAPPISTENGYLFIDNEYLPPPYEIALNKDNIQINDKVFKAETFDLSAYDHHGFGMRHVAGTGFGQQGTGPGGPGPNATQRWGEKQRGDPESNASQFAMRRLFEEFGGLSDGVMIVIRAGAKPMMLWPEQSDYGLLERLLANSEGQTQTAEIPYTMTDEGNRETWRQLISNFQPTPAFIERASQQIDEFNQNRSQVDAEIASIQWSGFLSYPITMLALVLVVIGLGNLMASAHAVFSATLNRTETHELSQNVTRLLFIMAFMSAIDLLWTVVAHQSGSMRELNPIGSRLIDSTTQLIAFKLVLTGTSIGLLFWLRRLPLTRKATWWCCLVMTLLTVRWLSFHSMLV